VVKFAVDGDSLTLDDGRRVRIIGLNTPELRPEPQPFARAAQARVQQLLRQNQNRVTLVSGPEKYDRHGRFLYHVLLQDRQPLAEILIAEGLAAQTAVAPNIHCADRYGATEQLARRNSLGLWSDVSFWQRSFKALKARESGFYLIQDKVDKVSLSADKARIKLQHGVVLHLPLPATLEDTQANELAVDELPGRVVEARGWIYRYQRQHHLNLYTAANLQIQAR